MSLKEEIEEKRKEMIVDSYPMSIGEVMNLYKDGEIDVHPEFQRFYRWDEEQNSLNLSYWVFLFLLFLFRKRQTVYGM